MSFFKKFFSKEKEADLNKSLEKTKEGLLGKVSRALVGKTSVDEDVLDELEEALISSDVGLDTTVKIIDRIQARVKRDKFINASELDNIMRDEIVQLLAENNTEEPDSFDLPLNKTGRPFVLLVVGVNGVGKTTTIGKLAHQLTKNDYRVVIGAADTFRAAAVEQLKIWANRVGCEFYSKGMNADPAAVAFETVQYAQRYNCDVAIIDTAGRLHNKIGLMNELGKIKRSLGKNIEGAPHEVLLVLDASTGQNALEQAKQFSQVTDITCLALTKLDGTAKGGVVLAIAHQFNIPVKFIGVGEKATDLLVFDKKEFVDGLFAPIP